MIKIWLRWGGGRIGTGVYVVWCNVHPANCRENAKRKKNGQTGSNGKSCVCL